MKNNFLAMKIVYEHAMAFNESMDDPAIIRNWVNRKTDRGYTALHFAAYHGDIRMVRFLVKELQADITLMNLQMQNVVHFAAQGDSAKTLVYFVKQRHMDVSSQDCKGRTPLHWAIH